MVTYKLYISHSYLKMYIFEVKSLIGNAASFLIQLVPFNSS